VRSLCRNIRQTFW